MDVMIVMHCDINYPVHHVSSHLSQFQLLMNEELVA